MLLALWQFASYFTPPYLFPPLQDVFARTLMIFVDLPLMVEVLETAARIFAGLFGAFFLGGVAGAADRTFGAVRKLEQRRSWCSSRAFRRCHGW